MTNIVYEPLPQQLLARIPTTNGEVLIIFCPRGDNNYFSDGGARGDISAGGEPAGLLGGDDRAADTGAWSKKKPDREEKLEQFLTNQLEGSL